MAPSKRWKLFSSNMVNGVSENPSFQFSYWFLKCKFGLSKKCTEKYLAKKLYCLLKWTQVPEKSFLGKKTYPLWIGSEHQQCAVVQFSAVTRLFIFPTSFKDHWIPIYSNRIISFQRGWTGDFEPLCTSLVRVYPDRRLSRLLCLFAEKKIFTEGNTVPVYRYLQNSRVSVSFKFFILRPLWSVPRKR